MAPENKDFYGKDVASAIKEACDTFGVAQENLTIEVVETGSTGIFGLIRKKAHIRVSVQQEEPAIMQKAERPAKPAREKQKKKAPVTRETVVESPKPVAAVSAAVEAVVEAAGDVNTDDYDPDDDNGDDDETGEEPLDLTPENLAVIKEELERILALMGCPSPVAVEMSSGTVTCKVGGEYETDLTGQEGRTLDSLQYLLRKIVSKKIPARLRLSIDIGNYRERRYQELRDQAIDLAALVKESGKTQVIPSLNPSERRVVHVALQDDTEIRSRSVGEGLFKKVLIYKPGKGRKNNGRKRPRGRSRRKGDPGTKKDQ